MARKEIMFGVGAGIFSLGADGVAGLMILRLLSHYLPPATAGFWVLVTSCGSLLVLMQSGLGRTVARIVAQCRASDDAEKLESVFGAVGMAVRTTAVIVIVLTTVLFFGYLWPAAQRGHLELAVALSWVPYAVGIGANLQGQADLFVLDGYGQVGWDRMFRGVFALVGIAAAWAALALGGRLMTLGFIYLTLNLLFWLAAHLKLRHFLGGPLRRRKPRTGQLNEIYIEASKLLGLNIMTYAITQFTVFIVEWRFGLDKVTPYQAMLRVGTLIGSVGAIVPQMFYPYVANLWATGNRKKCRQYYLFGVGASVALSVGMSLAIFLFAQPVFRLWLGPGQYLGNAVFGAVLLYYVLSVHHNAHATPTLAVSGNAFMVVAVINTVLVVGLVFHLPQRVGMLGFPLGMILGTVLPSFYVTGFAWRTLMHDSRQPFHPNTGRPTPENA